MDARAVITLYNLDLTDKITFLSLAIHWFGIYSSAYSLR